MSKRSIKAAHAFEQQIHKVYELLADSGAEVTWNDHLPDPDNPKQPRQIDITIKQGGILTLVECRQHKSKQNVKWIEELLGRRISLGAHVMIAVSSAGFAAGAQAKATKHGIILRDLQQLSDEEIVKWGQRVALTLFFYEYSDLEMSLVFTRDGFFKIEQNRQSRNSGDILVYSLCSMQQHRNLMRQNS